MGLARRLHEQLDAAADDRARFRLIVDAIGELEEAWPRPGEIARTTDVREAELRLQLELAGVRKDIEVVRKEIKEVELRLQGEIEAVRKEIKEVELRLQGEIEGVRKEIKEVELRLQVEIGSVRKEIKEVELRLQVEIESVRKEIKEVELRLRVEIEGVRKEIVQSKNALLFWLVPLMFAQVAAVAALVRLL